MERRGFIGAAIAALGATFVGSGKAAETEKQSYNPMWTPTNWVLPTKLRDVWTWAWYFADTDPEVSQLVSLYQHCFVKRLDEMEPAWRSHSIGVSCDDVNAAARSLAAIGNAFVASSAAAKCYPKEVTGRVFVDAEVIHPENIEFKDGKMSLVNGYDINGAKPVRPDIPDEAIRHLRVCSDGQFNYYGVTMGNFSWRSCFKYLAFKSKLLDDAGVANEKESRTMRERLLKMRRELPSPFEKPIAEAERFLASPYDPVGPSTSRSVYYGPLAARIEEAALELRNWVLTS